DLRYPDLSGLYAAVGEGRISAQSVVTRLVRAVSGTAGAQEDLAEATPIPPKAPKAARARTAGDSGIEVEGVADVWVRLSKCCTPVPGDEIQGFVTHGHGVSVHRANCVNLEHLSDTQRQRTDDPRPRSPEQVHLRNGRPQAPRRCPARGKEHRRRLRRLPRHQLAL